MAGTFQHHITNMDSSMPCRKASSLGWLRCCFILLVLASAVSADTSGAGNGNAVEIEQAVTLLESLGVRLCRVFDDDDDGSIITHRQHHPLPLLPLCDSDESIQTSTSLFTTSGVSATSPRRMLEESDTADDEEEEGGDFSWVWNVLAATICVCIAALAAGLTLGMLGLDPLMLLIKERAAESPIEREQARKLIPIINQHHRLLVTLLLMNAVANEALPIFLEKMVPPSVAVLLSVTLVLFFGEIIPSAVFTGPDQLQIASRLTPVVQAAMCLLYPVAGPIAKLLDYVLHGDGDEEMNAYNRGELSALIRIQYEDRLANKQKRKLLREQAEVLTGGHLFAESDHVGALDFTKRTPGRYSLEQQSLRANRNQLEHAENALSPSNNINGSLPMQSVREHYERPDLERSDSIHIDEVSMVEGALQMKTKVALDVYTSIRRAFCIPGDMIMTERNMVKVYSSGFSRIPVYQHVPEEEEIGGKKGQKDSTHGKWRLCGVLIAKQLIVVDPEDQRRVDTLPLYCPLCVSPSSSLIDLLNLFQTGGKGMRGGHMALVCAQPHVGNKALRSGECLPKEAGLIGIITLEDVLEALLQEQIYDEYDREERTRVKLATMVLKKWRLYVKRKKEGLLQPADVNHNPAMLSVVAQAMKKTATSSPVAMEEGLAEETTTLLVKHPRSNSKSKITYFT
jgi:metal transporter CNNM